MIVMIDHHWRCALTGEVDHPVAFALFSRRHLDMPPILISPAGLKATLEQQAQDLLVVLERCKHNRGNHHP
jgi:hypothetical protein